MVRRSFFFMQPAEQDEDLTIEPSLLADGFPLPNQWNIVHSIALNENAQLLCAADRENYRIQCFNSTSGEFLRQIRVEKKNNIGAIYAIEFIPNSNGQWCHPSTISPSLGGFDLGTILFAVTGGAQVTTKKVYMIDAQNGDILTSFDSTPVRHSIADERKNHCSSS